MNLAALRWPPRSSRMLVAVTAALVVFDLCAAILALRPGFIGPVFALGLMLIGIGHALAARLFRRSGGLDPVSTLAVGECLAIALVGAGGLALNWLPAGLTRPTATMLVSALAALSFALSIGGSAWSPRGLSRLPIRDLASSCRGRSIAQPFVTLGLAGLLVAVTLQSVQAAARPAATSPMTEFYLLATNGELLDTRTDIGQDGEFVVLCGMVNHEGKPGTYHVSVSNQEGLLFESGPVGLADGQTELVTLSFRIPPESASPSRIDFVLYRQGEKHRQLHAWIENYSQAKEP